MDLIVSMNFNYNMALKETGHLLSIFTKENTNLINLIRTLEQLSPTDQELMRESLKANIQLGFQIQRELDKFLVSYKEDKEFIKMESDFQLGCRILGELSERILYKEKQQRNIYEMNLEQIPLLNDSDMNERVEEEKKGPFIVIENKTYNRTSMLQEADYNLRYADEMKNQIIRIVQNRRHPINTIAEEKKENGKRSFKKLKGARRLYMKYYIK